MENNERYYDRENEYRRRQGNDQDHHLSNYQSRYQDRGNYYGMPDQDREYQNVRSSEDSFYGRNTSGPVSSYGANSYWDSDQNFRDRDHDRDRSNSQRGSQNQWSSQNRSSRGGDYQGSGNYNHGRDWEGRSSNASSDRGDSGYRYGDPNPYMGNDRNGGYERTRGTGWRSESDDYNANNQYNQDRYSRQDNSYRAGGQGRRYSEYGRDELNSYGQHEARGEQLDHGYTDRGDTSNSRWDNNFDPSRQSGNRREDYSPHGYNADRPNLSNQEDNYATGSYSSNRAYLADHGQDRNEGLFDHSRNDYPATSRHGDRHRSGPNWSADSAASDYTQGDLRG